MTETAAAGVDLATTLTGLLAQVAARHPDGEVRHGDVAVAYRDLPDRVARLAGGLTAWGVAPGDHVAIWMRNRLEWVDAWFAVASVGAVLVPLNTRFAAAEAEYVLRQSRSSWLLWAAGEGALDAAALEAMEERGFAPKGRAVFGAEPTTPGEMRFADLSAGPVPPVEDESAVGMIQYTSGSTAFPKGAMLRNRSLVRNAHGLAAAWQVTAEDRVLCSNPLFHCGGSVFAFLAGFVAGASVTLLDRWDVATAVDVMEADGVTVFPGIDAAVRDLVSFGRRPPSLRLVSTAADPGLMQQAATVLGCEVSNVYGLTESSPNVFVGDLRDPLAMRIERIGQAQPGLEVGIRDPDTRLPLPPGETGVIVVRGWSLMTGYYDDPEATAATLDADGYLWTGDLGMLTPDGYLFYKGRRKQMIKSGGENVSIDEVEEALRSHPDAVDAVVVAVPHARFGEVGFAFVRAGEGAVLSPEELSTHCRTRLAGFKVPKHIRVVEDLPRTGSGKVDRQGLAAEARAIVEGA
ncbi:MAG TPA: class I adenylate-forming enzyme family protein [Acidimicrobiales bacterium]|nr:class I adenylate-forming enzyme family protein [Acidimicrobiales bacterium]